MNYLAHIFLAGNDKYLQIGGFIADFVKGNKSTSYPPKLWSGIQLHREIDTFTDTHPIVRELVDLMRPEFGRYSAIILDMYFDYFLASNFRKFSMNQNLYFYSIRFSLYAILFYKYLPKRVKGFIFHFIGSNRLYNYSTIEGLNKSLEIMSHYKVKALKPDKCILFLLENKEMFENKFFEFFDELMEFSNQKRMKL